MAYRRTIHRMRSISCGHSAQARVAARVAPRPPSQEVNGHSQRKYRIATRAKTAV